MSNEYAAGDEQSHKRNDRKGRRRMRIVGMLVLCFIVWAVITSMQQLNSVNEKRLRVAVLQEQLNESKQKNEKLMLEITRLNDPEYIEQKAKKDYQMIRPGETLFTEPEKVE